MTPDIRGKRVLIIAADGFEQSGVFEPRQALQEAGAATVLAASQEQIRGWSDKGWSEALMVEARLNEVSEEDFDALLIPGGSISTNKLCMDAAAVKLVEDFYSSGKAIAAICHGPQMLIAAKVLQNVELTSYPTLRQDIENAGGSWVDQEVVVDRGLVTSRTPADLPAFIAKTIEEISEGSPGERSAA